PSKQVVKREVELLRAPTGGDFPKITTWVKASLNVLALLALTTIAKRCLKSVRRAQPFATRSHAQILCRHKSRIPRSVQHFQVKSRHRSAQISIWERFLSLRFLKFLIAMACGYRLAQATFIVSASAAILGTNKSGP